MLNAWPTISTQAVLRETRNFKLAVEAVIHSMTPAQLVGKMLVCTGNCAPAIQGLLKMQGSVEVFPEVKQV